MWNNKNNKGTTSEIDKKSQLRAIQESLNEMLTYRLKLKNNIEKKINNWNSTNKQK